MQAHVSFFQRAAAFDSIAMDAGCYHIGPGMFTAQFPGNYVIQCKIAILFSTILAGVAIAPEDLMPGKWDLETRTLDHMFQPDDRRPGKGLRNRIDLTASINDQRGATGKDQVQRSMGATYVYGLKIGI